MNRRLSRLRAAVIRVERHKLGPRVHVFGRRVHEYQVGFALLAASPVASVESQRHISVSAALAAFAGLWLVVKDWPDLFRSTRDRASWRLGVHRLPPKSDRLSP
jgi:hypothetical protein